MKLQELKRTLPYKWRVQSLNEYGAVCVAYIDSRDVQDLLDEVCGPENWQSDYKEVKGNLYAGVSIRIGEQWVWKWDCGVESKTEAEKGEASDSFKRAAVKWGVGRFLYALDIVKLGVNQYKGKNYPAKADGAIIFSGDDLTDYINNMGKQPEPKPKPKPDLEPLRKEVTKLLSRAKEEQRPALLAKINSATTEKELNEYKTKLQGL